MKSIIGIVSKPSMENDMWHYMGIVDEIRYVLIKNNALVVGILPTEYKLDFKRKDELDTNDLTEQEKKDLELVLSRLDGVILQGGLVSNRYEEEIAKICIEKDIPILGICSGFNNLIRALDGNVHKDSTNFHNKYGKKIAHEVEIEQNSKLFEILKKTNVNVNSIHNWVASEKEVKNYKVVARCPIDNTVEAIELENKKFVMGIKWHPELLEDMNSIFAEFVRVCEEKYKTTNKK